MDSFTYHSPDGDRQLFANGENTDGTVDLQNADGVLEIGGCKVESRLGGCTKAAEPEKKKAHKSLTH